MTNGTISEKCEELYNKLNSFVTSVINRDVTPQINNLQTGKADVGHLHTTTQVASQDALVNIGTSAGATQRMINGAIDSKVGSLDTSITNITTWESIDLLNGLTLVYNPALRLAKLTVNRATTGTLSNTTFTTITGFNPIPEDYRPHINLIFETSYPTLMLRVDTSGYLQWRVTSGSVSSPVLWCESPFWHY